MRTLKVIITAFVMIIVLTVVAVVATVINPKLGATAIETFTYQPYEVILYSYSLPTFAMPGQGGDRDGFARVYNTVSGRLLCEMDIPMAGHVHENDIRWWPKSVSLPGDQGFQDCPLS